MQIGGSTTQGASPRVSWESRLITSALPPRQTRSEVRTPATRVLVRGTELRGRSLLSPPFLYAPNPLSQPQTVPFCQTPGNYGDREDVGTGVASRGRENDVALACSPRESGMEKTRHAALLLLGRGPPAEELLKRKSDAAFTRGAGRRTRALGCRKRVSDMA